MTARTSKATTVWRQTDGKPVSWRPWEDDGGDPHSHVDRAIAATRRAIGL